MDEQTMSDDDTRSMGSSMDWSISDGQSSEECHLSWRSDPSFSFSDWTIRIQIKAESIDSNARDEDLTTPIEIYHVHRNILAIGSRRSGYFGTLFHYGIDDGDHCTNVGLNVRAASFFPDLLDYMYTSEAFAISTRNAVALLFLSQAFQIAALEKQVERFIESDINLTNFGRYMSDALYFCDERMAMKVMDTCGNEILQFCGNNNDLIRILRAPIDSTRNKAKEKIQETWTFLTSASKALLVPGIASVKIQTFSWRSRQQE